MLSQTVEYALRAMSSLAYRPSELVPTPELAEITKVPSNYLAKVLQTLAAADLIVGRRGVGGGYRLARPPAEINLLDVINAVSPVERITTCPLGLENHGASLCPLHKRMDEAARLVIELFGSTSLADIVSGEGTPQLPLCNEKMTQQIRIDLGKG
ncbi:MAG: Rrf2 family transcriptional regulator [Planctomycetota bacterium]|nr:MAG: Rrf2 family transcriptional regulator [Planctomycetota bacterium]